MHEPVSNEELLRLYAFVCLITTQDREEFCNAYKFITGSRGGGGVWYYMNSRFCKI